MPNENARKLMQGILQRVATVKNHDVAAAIGKDESTVSRIVSGESGVKLTDLHPFLACLGLKVVPWGHICIDSAEWEATQVLARKYMETMDKPVGPIVDWNS